MQVAPAFCTRTSTDLKAIFRKCVSVAVFNQCKCRGVIVGASLDVFSHMCRFLPMLTHAERGSTQRYLVRTSEVAPIIIRNCKEEYQHVVDFKEPITYGKIADNMPEHALLRVRVCSVLTPCTLGSTETSETVGKFSTAEFSTCAVPQLPDRWSRKLNCAPRANDK